jgi:hypothetical protein
MRLRTGAALAAAAVLLAGLGTVPTSALQHPEHSPETWYQLPPVPLGGAVGAAPDDAAPQRPASGVDRPSRTFVAYYGTAQTPTMGVLGEGTIPEMTKRLRRAAKPYRARGRPVQIVYELIVTVADAHPGSDGDYSHFIPRRYVERFIRAARRHEALLVLDLQPGRSTFVEQASRFRWALRRPHVGLALDPEWRMGPGEVPAEEIGSVRAREINKVSRMVARIVRAHELPRKLFVIHQFRTDMVRSIERVRTRRPLVTVQHVDGFGTQAQKLATYHHVARPGRFHMGFKLFYDEDTNLFTPREVLRIRPRVRYVSYQ